MLTDAVAARLTAQIAALDGHVGLVADLSELVARNALPPSPAQAFVVHAGFRPRQEPDSSAGAFTQLVDEIVAVVLVVRAAGDVTGARADAALDPLRAAVLLALCGFAPDHGDATGVPIGDFRLLAGQLVSMKAGTLIYQLEFACPLQLRIFS